MKDEELIKLLDKWFKKNLYNQNKWCSPVGSVIKKYLNLTKNWKNAPRGDSKLGFRIMMENKNRE
jgi:hypothetical protein